MAPWVSELKQLNLFTFVLEFVDGDYGIGVTHDHTSFIISVLTLPMAGRHHSEVSRIRRLKHIEELLSALELAVLVAFRGHAHNVRSGETGQSAFYPGIGSMQLGPCFLEETDPDLSISASCEGRLSVLANRQMIIDDHWGFSAVDKKSHHVDTSLVDLFRHKHVLDSLRELS